MRLHSLIAAALALALCACGAPSEMPAEEAPPPDVAEPGPAPSEPGPPAPDDAAQPAPTGPETQPEPTAPVTEDRATAEEPEVPIGTTWGGGTLARDRVVTAVLVELMPTEARAPRQGGSAVALLADPASEVGAGKNLVLCQGLFRSFDQATSGEVQVGARVGAEGEVELLRPIYWLTRAVTPGQRGADRCPQRLESFDYPRAERIARKLGLAGAGPYLVVERHDLFENERVAAVIDLSRTAPGEIVDAVRYFRDGFMQAGDAWAPERFQRARARSDVIAFFGAERETGFLPRLVRASRQVGCPLTNLLDICTEPG